LNIVFPSKKSKNRARPVQFLTGYGPTVAPGLLVTIDDKMKQLLSKL